MSNEDQNWVFFGTSDFAVILLEELKRAGILPNLIITTPDRPKGRHREMTPSPVKEWATANDIEILQPERLKDEEFISKLKAKNSKLFIVAAYGKIIPKIILDLPAIGSFNIHPSLLPKYRGPSPLQYQILNDEKEIGTTIIKMDEEVDHGPILVQEKVDIPDWPVSFKKLEKIMAETSARKLAEIWPAFWRSSLPSLKDQDHSVATFTKMITKEDGLLKTEDDSYQNYLKYLAFEEWPETYFFQEGENKSVRLKIKEAHLQNNQFIIDRVTPEGKSEMSYEDFLKGF
ncbi:MAG TPA: methionyl-tRNA formyltransferase [Candidatus Paceibacterota bacterium]|nr:methionyl-tRNA formyltransferase [Candidatus Paceibacterota bacterium]